jgi:UDPglucose--hexose-1-phosphate uridylyltransferase
MPELRIDPITARRVFVAEERAGRPFDYAAAPAHRPSSASDCPFCAGHEHLTPDATAQLADDAGRWQVRVIPNKYPAVVLAPPAGRAASVEPGAAAIGAHEVIVEAPHHAVDLVQLTVDQATRVLTVYRDRLRHWSRDHALRHALIFKNSGYAAGASLEHVHSQLMALPVVAAAVQAELDAAARHFAAGRSCIFCDWLRDEIADGRRVVSRNQDFAAVCAVAPRQPYETWLLPADHNAQFESLESADLRRLAEALLDLLGRLAEATAGAAYNLVLHTADFAGAHRQAYHWHWELIPRITQLAGLELGGGSFICPVAPERAAQRLREARPGVARPPLE